MIRSMKFRSNTMINEMLKNALNIHEHEFKNVIIENVQNDF